MAHFAKLDSNNIVTAVLVVHNNDAPDEAAGIAFLNSLLGAANWKQTSYNHRTRKQYAGVGYSYNATADVFIAPRPFPSWSLDANHDWQAPVPYPDLSKWYRWDESTLAWELIPLRN